MSGDFKDLICPVKTLLEFTEDGEISEDPAHKMFSFKVGDIIVKWYSSTNTVQTQRSGDDILQEKLGNLFASKKHLLALQPNSDTQHCLLATSNESTAVDSSFNSGGGGRYFQKSWVGVCGPLPPHPIYDQNLRCLLPYL